MIAGAMEIICGVEAAVVNPLLLPATQGEEKFAYIVITYDDIPDVFDILFVHGNHVKEYASLHHELRSLVGVNSVRMLLSACCNRCRVYLFSVSPQGFERFLRTFYCEPTLNVVIDRLSKNQISGLLMDSSCRNGILEVDRVGRPFPQIDLARFHSQEELLREASRFRRGRLILYDLELNSALRQRADFLQGGVPGSDMDLDHVEPENNVSAAGERPEKSSVIEPPAGPAPAPQADTPPPPPPEEPAIVALFRNALKEFTEAFAHQYGTRLNRKMDRLLCRLFDQKVGFEPGLISQTNYVNVLVAIEQGVDLSWTYKRKHIRNRAREIVKNLYETHNELLRRHEVEERVHECYLALKP